MDTNSKCDEAQDVRSELTSLQDKVNGVLVLDRIVAESLASLYADLRPWHEREQEIVNLYAFGHLAPLLLSQPIDTGLLAIEGRIPQLTPKIGKRLHPKRRHFDECVRADLVIRKQRHECFFRVDSPAYRAQINSSLIAPHAPVEYIYEDCTSSNHPLARGWRTIHCRTSVKLPRCRLA